MPTFKRHTSTKRKPIKRTFVRNKRTNAKPTTSASEKIAKSSEKEYFSKKEEVVVESKPVIEKSSEPKISKSESSVDVMSSLEQAKQSFMAKVNEPEDLKMPQPQSIDDEGEEDKEIEDIQKLIQQATKRLTELEQKASEAPMPQDETPIEAFNGVSESSEQVEILAAQLERSQREARELRQKMLELEQVQKHEKEQMNKTLHTMRKDMHRAAPLHDTKFFSLSNELKDAIKAIENITETDLESIDLETVATAPGLVLPQTEPVTSVEQTPIAKPATPAPQPHETEKPKEVTKEAPAEDSPKEPVDPKKKKKKMLITGAAAVAVLLILSGALSFQLKSGSEVDDALVEEYLKQQTGGELGDVAGITTENPSASDTVTPPSPVQQQTQPTKFDQAQADVSLAQTVWDSFNDPIFGMKMEYPVNAVNIIKTDSSITFIRKNGYIFKVQRIETALELEEYWKQIKATSLNYKVTPKDFAKQKSLHLELEDITDFPGDRYLVKIGDVIYDVWYATASEKFVDDDMKRVERMLSSVIFEGNDTAEK